MRALHCTSSSRRETNSGLLVCSPEQLSGHAAMVEKRRTNRHHGDDGPVVTSLAALRSEEDICQRCPLYKNATQAVPGEGPKRASMMLVGEQPGDQEDRTGHPFVGPAGRLLDQALADAGIA